MARSFVNLDKVIFSKMGSDGATNPRPIGLRYPAKLTMEDDPLEIEKGIELRNWFKFMLEAESVQCDYDFLKDCFEVFIIDGMVDAHVVTSAQQATVDARGLRGNEVLNFGDFPSNNGYLSFGMVYTEEYTNSVHKTSCVLKGDLTIEKFDADLILSQNQTNTSTLTDDQTLPAVSPGHISEISTQNMQDIFSKGDIKGYKLTLETVGDDPDLHGRVDPQYIRATIEITSSRNCSIDRFRDLCSEANTFPVNSNLSIKHRLSLSTDFEKFFNFKTLGMTNSFETADKRHIVSTWQGNIPVLDVVCTSTASLKKIQFG